MPDFQGGVSRTQTSLLESENREDLRMTLELVLALAAIINCIATVASAVIAILSYLKKELEKLKLTKQFKQLELLDKLKDSIKEMNIIDKNFIENNFADGIVSEIKEIDFLELEKEKIYKKFGDLVEIVTPTDNIECDNIEYDIKIENNILLVYGNIIIINETDIYTINYLRESSDDWYIDNEVWVKLSMDFSFNINVNEDEINIENFELSKENISDFKLSNIQVVDIIK